ERLAGLLLDRREAGLHLRLEIRRIRPLVIVEVGADFRGDREAGRHRQSDPAHLGQPGALAAEQRLHAAVAVGLRFAEQVDVLPPLRVGGWALGAGGWLFHWSLGHQSALDVNQVNRMMITSARRRWGRRSATPRL